MKKTQIHKTVKCSTSKLKKKKCPHTGCVRKSIWDFHLQEKNESLVSKIEFKMNTNFGSDLNFFFTVCSAKLSRNEIQKFHILSDMRLPFIRT